MIMKSTYTFLLRVKVNWYMRDRSRDATLLFRAKCRGVACLKFLCIFYLLCLIICPPPLFLCVKHRWTCTCLSLCNCVCCVLLWISTRLELSYQVFTLHLDPYSQLFYPQLTSCCIKKLLCIYQSNIAYSEVDTYSPFYFPQPTFTHSHAKML